MGMTQKAIVCDICNEVLVDCGKVIWDCPHAFNYDTDEELIDDIEEQHKYCEHRPEIYDEPDTADMCQSCDWEGVLLSDYAAENWEWDIIYGIDDETEDIDVINRKRERVLTWIQAQEKAGKKPEEMDLMELWRIYFADGDSSGEDKTQ